MTFLPPAVEDIPKPYELVAAMDQTVAGLEKVKKRLAFTLYRFMVAAVHDRPWRPANILVIGPSGGGKTHILRALLDACPVIKTEVTATEYSDVGFTGRNLTSMYLGLMSPDQRGDQHRKVFLPWVERFGCVVIDEFDKLRVGPGSDDGRQGGKMRAMQAELLKLVEGAEIRVQLTDDDRGFLMRTHQVLHIAVGAFQGLKDVLANRTGQSVDDPKILEQTGIWDIVRYGFLEELVGRFASIVPLEQLTTDHLVRIMNEQMIPAYQRELADIGVTLKCDPGSVSWMAGYALGTPIGARALAPLMDSLLWEGWSVVKPGQELYLPAEIHTTRTAQVRERVVA